MTELYKLYRGYLALITTMIIVVILGEVSFAKLAAILLITALVQFLGEACVYIFWEWSG